MLVDCLPEIERFVADVVLNVFFEGVPAELVAAFEEPVIDGVFLNGIVGEVYELIVDVAYLVRL